MPNSKPARTRIRRRAIPDLDTAGTGRSRPTPRALADLARLHRFLAPKNPDAARRAVRAIRDGLRLLETHPEAGRPTEGMEPEFREWWIAFGGSGYLALYRLDGARIIVLAVRHGRELGF